MPRRPFLSDSRPAINGQRPRAFFTPFASALILLLLTNVAASAGFVYETPAEFLTSGDFNGDGIADVLVLDRATGNARVGYRDATNTLTWSAPLITGVTSPDGLTVGRFLQTNQEALAITSIELNRVQLVDLSNPSNAPAPTVLTPAGLGPNLLIGLAAPYGALGRFDWLLVGNADPGQARAELFGFLQGPLASSLDSGALPAPLARGNALQLGAGLQTFAAAIQRGTNDQFIVYAPSNHFSPLITRSNLPAGSDYVFGQFNGEALPRFIFYVPGQSNLTVQTLVPTNGGFVFDAGISVSFAEAVQGVYYVSEGTDGCALVQFGDGVEGLRLPGGVANVSAVYRSGGGAAGNVFTGLVPLSNGNFVLLDGPPGSGISAHAQVVHFDGTNYTQTSAGNLPSTTTHSTRANIWLFQAEPFVSDAPGFIASLNAPDWSDGIYGLPATLAVQTESDIDLTSGLGNATLHSLGSPPGGAAFALPDQYRDFISLFTYSSPRAPEAVTVTISPAAGLYGGRIVVSFTTLNVQDKVFYRLGTDPWRPFLVRFPLTNDVTIQYYGTNYLTTSRSRLLSASYSFGHSGGAPQAPVDLAPGSTNPAPVFSPNQLVLSELGTVFYGRRSASNNGTIWAINLDGSGETYITAGARPRVSKDGRYLAFLRDGNPLVTQGNAWVRDLLSGQETLLFTNQNYVIGYDWDRTGTNLVFDFSCWLFSIGLNGPGSMLPLANPDCYDDAPVVNPSDGRLAFHNLNPNGPTGLYVTTADTTAKQRLNLINVEGASWPAWSPDGQWLAFADGNSVDNAFTADGGMNLYVVQPDGTGLSQITGFTDGINRFPHGAVWSPEGEALVGAGTIFGTNGLWVIPLTPDYTECDCPPILLPTSPGDAIDFAGSIVVAAPAPQTVVGPGLFIRLEPDAAVVYWGAIFADFTLESTTGLLPTSTWTAISRPYAFDGYFYLYREPLAALQQQQFFRLRKP